MLHAPAGMQNGFNETSPITRSQIAKVPTVDVPGSPRMSYWTAASSCRAYTLHASRVDSPFSGAPFSAGARNFTDPCISHSPAIPGTSSSYLTIQTSGAYQAFYIHIFDFDGRARPDFTYNFSVTKQ